MYRNIPLFVFRFICENDTRVVGLKLKDVHVIITDIIFIHENEKKKN